MSVYHFGPFELDEARCELRRDGQVVPVQRKVFDLLRYLVAHRDRLVTKEELLDEVWQETAVSEASLTVSVSALRKALQDRSRASRWLATVRGRGYRFVGDVVVSERRPLAGPAPGEEAQRGSDAPLVGRGAERKLIERTIVDAVSGRDRIVIVEGEPGIGKSRLLALARDLGERAGCRVVGGLCRDEASAPPLWPWVRIVRSLLAEAEDGEARCTGALAALPEFADLVPEDAPRLAIDPRSAPFLAYEAVRSLLRARARRQPVVVLLDDLQWADASSLALFSFVARELGPARVAILASTRPQAREASRALGEVARQPNCTTTRLRGLDPVDVAELVRRIEGDAVDPQVVAQLARQSGGNPFFLLQLLPLTHQGRESRSGVRSVRSPVLKLPVTVLKAIAQHCDVLSDAARDVLRAAAAIGSSFSTALLAQVVGLSPAEVLALLDAALAERLIERDPDRAGSLRFSHALVRDVLHEELGLERQSEVHWRIGHAIAGSATLEPVQRIEEIAYHFSMAAPAYGPERAVHYLERAGDAAARHGLHDSAISHYEQALVLLAASTEPDEGARCRLLVSLGRASWYAGSLDAAMDLWLRAAEQACAIDSAADLIDAALALGATFNGQMHRIDRPRIARILEAAVAVTGTAHPAERAPLLARWAQMLAYEGRNDQAERTLAAAREIVERIHDRRVEIECLSAELGLCCRAPDAARRVRVIEAILERADPAGDPATVSTTRFYYAAELLEQGLALAADEQISQIEALCAEAHLPEARVAALRFRSMRALMGGDLDRAEADNAEAMRAAADCDPWVERPLQMQAFAIAYMRGRLTRAILESLELGPADAIVLLPAFLQLGERAEVARRLPPSFRSIAVRSSAVDWLPAAVIVAQAVAYVGDGALAPTLIDWLEPFAQRHVTSAVGVAYLGPIDRFLALLHSTLEHHERAFELFEAALRQTAEVGARSMTPAVQMDLARAHLHRGAAGDRARAVELRHAVLRAAPALGLAGLEREARELSIED